MSGRASSARADRRGELLVAAAAVLSVLTVLECGFRVQAWRTNRRTFDRVKARAQPPAKGARVRLGHMIRPSSNPRIVYELWPGMDVLFDESGKGAGSRVRTSAAGFRDRDYPVHKPPGTRRLIGIGDSLMFGWGVDQGLDYLSVLELRLDGNAGQGSWQVLNTAVPGYNLAMEVETLKTKGLPYRPDVVVVGFCPNDASLPNFILPGRDVLSLRESFLAGFVRGRLRPPLETADALIAAPRRADDRAFEDDPRRAPEPYREITGWDAFGQAMAELKRLGEIHGFRTIVVAFVPGFDDPRKSRGLEVARAVGLTVMDVGRTETEYMRTHGIGEYLGSALTVSADDPHPSALAHELAAEDLLRELAREGLLDRAPSRGPAARDSFTSLGRPVSGP